jgi:hypothetical protein
MGRPARKGLDYFNLDCDQEDNLNFLEAKHGIVGYGVIVKLWKKIYQINGYYCEWTEKNIYLFSKEVQVPVDKVKEILASCFEESLFDRTAFERYQILTSRGIQKRWKKIVTEAKRKETEVNPLYSLLPLEVVQSSFNPDQTQIIPDETTQRKEKKKNVKDPEAAQQVGEVSGKDKAGKYNSELYKQIWFAFIKSKFGKSPLFSGEDPRLLKSLISKLKLRITEAGQVWNDNLGAEVFLKFLEAAYSDKWLAEHFLLRNLDTKFEQIERSSSGFKNDTKISLNPEAEIQLLYERFLKGDAKWETYNPALTGWLQQENLLSLPEHDQVALQQEAVSIRINQLLGSNQAKDLRALEQYQKAPPVISNEDIPAFERIYSKRALLAFFASAKEMRKINCLDSCT